MNTEIERSIMCRACMKVDGVLLPMYGDDMISKKNLPDKLADLASIQIDKYDGLPTVLCAKCAYRTDAFYDFKLQVQATERKLRKMFQSSNSQEIFFKCETNSVDCDDDNNQDNELPQAKSNSPTNVVRLSTNTAMQFEKGSKMAIKPSLEVNQLDEENCMTGANEQYKETINFVNDPLSENVGLSTLQNLDQILISDINNIIEEKQNELQGTKQDVPEEIQEIFHTENLGYTFFYIPGEEVADLDPQNSQEAISMEQEEVDEEQRKDYVCAFNEDPEVEEIIGDKDSSSELVSWSPKDYRNDEESITEKGKWPPKISYAIIENNDIDEAEKPKNNNGKSKRNKATTKSNEDSDSDYFVDPQDNLLGSLNDTIMRIKEIKVEGDETNYQCTLCMQNYDKLAGVLIHTVDNHVPISGPFFCVVCEKDCESHRDLRSHVKTHSGKFPYTCFICNKAYSMKRYLKRHMACHTDFPRHRCPKCGMRFTVKTELETHLRSHVHGGAPFECSQCPRVFNHKGNFKRHLISHLDPHGIRLPKYPCEVCGKRFLNNRTLETHRRVHTGEKPFQCDICSRSFSQQGNLLNHLRIHSNPRSYTCEVCGKRFNQRATLRDHGLLHTGEKPYVCNVCGVAFTFSAALRRHMWTHASDKPFACEICNARFVGKYDITRHMKIHTDRPKNKRRRNQLKNDETREDISGIDETPVETEISNDTTNIFIEHQVLFAQSSTEIRPQEEAEKENVDALFNLMQYGYATTYPPECHTSYCFNSCTLNGQSYYPSQVLQKTSNERYQNSLYFTKDKSVYIEKQRRSFLALGSSDAVHAADYATVSGTSASDTFKLAPRKNYVNGGILETALVPGPTKIEIIPGSGIYIKINDLDRWTRAYGQKSNKLACRLMRLIVGEENLAGMSVTGRGLLQRIPRRAYDAVEAYVSSYAMPKMNGEKFQKTMKFLCRTVRKSRELK